MNPRTVSARDLETLARAAHADIELPGPEGGWATAVINGREYRAAVAPVPVRIGEIDGTPVYLDPTLPPRVMALYDDETDTSWSGE